MNQNTLLAFLVGILQGIFEWLPISSQGNITLAVKYLTDASPEAALSYALFLHFGTAISATLYYQDDLQSVIQSLPSWRPQHAFDEECASLSFLTIASIASGTVGILLFTLFEKAIESLNGGTFIALIGVLLVITGLLQRFANSLSIGGRSQPRFADAILVGVAQGFAILPGVSRSGTTISTLLLRGYDETASFHLSFLLSIPAAIGGGLIIILETGGIPTVTPIAAVVAISTAAIVGYLTIGTLIRLVNKVSFSVVCIGLGLFAIIGGIITPG